MNSSAASASSALSSRASTATNAPVPTFKSLFWHDALFGKAVKTAGFAAFVAAGMWWASRPMPNVAVQVDRTFEDAVGEIVPIVGLAVSAVAVLLAFWRRMYVRKVFTEGSIVQGKVVKLKCEKWETSANVDQSHGSKTQTRYSYYITFSYSVNGEERTLKRKLPNSGFVFGLHEGGTVELMVHPSKPSRPLIRPVLLKK